MLNKNSSVTTGSTKSTELLEIDNRDWKKYLHYHLQSQKIVNFNGLNIELLTKSQLHCSNPFLLKIYITNKQIYSMMGLRWYANMSPSDKKSV